MLELELLRIVGVVDVFHGGARLILSIREKEPTVISAPTGRTRMLTRLDSGPRRLLLLLLFVVIARTRLRPGIHHLDFLDASAHHAIVRILVGAAQKGTHISSNGYKNWQAGRGILGPAAEHRN